MSSPDPSLRSVPDPDSSRRVLEAWVAEQAGLLEPAACDALSAERPDWRTDAAQLIAEGLLAYVVLEMVAPDLAIARAEGRPAHTDDADLAARLVAHLEDFLDYRTELQERGGLPAEAAADDNKH